MLIPFSSQVLGDHGGDTGAIVLYAGNLTGVILVGNLMFSDARRSGLSKISVEEAGENRRRSLVIAAVLPRLDPDRPD